jgi:site-specific recombinase XerD
VRGWEEDRLPRGQGAQTLPEQKQEKQRRRKGEGSVYRKASSPFWILQFVHQGRAYIESSETEDEHKAYQKLEELKARVRAGVAGTPQTRQIRVNDLFQLVKDDWHRMGRDADGSGVRRWETNMGPFFGPMRAQDVSNEVVLRYVRKREAEHVEGATIGRELNIVRRCFKLGLRGNPPMIRSMPYFPTFADNKREGFMETDFHDAFAEACRTVRRGGAWLEGVFEVAYTYGWRHGEVVKLEVSQVRFLSPQEGLIRLPGDRSKNREARDVPFHRRWCPRLVEILREAVHGKQPEDRLFTRGKGADREVKRFDKLWRLVTAMAGMTQRLLVHDLRRTACRNMLEAGMTKEDIKIICGWKTDSMFNRYALRNPERLRREMHKLGEYREIERKGRADVVKQEKMRAMSGKHKLRISYDPRKRPQRATETSPRLAPVRGKQIRGLAGK